MILRLLFFTMGLLISNSLIARSVLEDSKTNLQAFDLLSSEIERLDASALPLHQLRSKTWFQIKSELRSELLKATGPEQIARVFTKLDRAYSNSHTYLDLDPKLKVEVQPQIYTPSVNISVDWLSENRLRLRIGSLQSEVFEFADTVDTPKIGDEIIEINGRSVEIWLEENFNFCKLSLKEQCAFEFQDNFYSQLLSWNANQSIQYTLKRGKRIWNLIVPVKVLPIKDSVRKSNHCSEEFKRYPDFHLVYAGNRACVFESNSDSSIAILRITSFSYRKLNTKDTFTCSTKLENTIASVLEEVNCLRTWWAKNATWKHLIIDVIDNRGGNDPAPYFKLIFSNPIQEDRVLIKKIAELEDPEINRSIFYDQVGMTNWFSSFVKTQSWREIPVGEMLPSVSVYCPAMHVPCNEYWIEPSEHSFNGKVSVLVNHKCASSCDGFVWLLQSRLGQRARFFGQPNAADGAWGLLNVDITLDDESGRLNSVVRSLDRAPSPGTILTQIVVVTRSVSHDGNILDGTPVRLDKFIPWTIENQTNWVIETIKATLE